MKQRIYTLCFLLVAGWLCIQAEPYFVRVNGQNDYPATNTGEQDFQGRVQYRAENVILAEGDKVTCYDKGSGAEWNVGVIDPYGAYQNFEVAADAIICKKAGTYDMYIKLKFEDDMWYIEEKAPVTGPFYIAGNGEQGGVWCCGLSWDEKGCELDENGSITFSLAEGDYQFKITNGTWEKCWGAAAVDAACSSEGYVATSDGNVRFQIAEAGDVTISFTNGQICLQGKFKEMNGSAVPSKCGDVLLQAFYYDSYEVDETHLGTEDYGDTKWKTLLKQAGEIGAYFDLVWLPPSGYASGVGYHPKQYSNQNSDWGSRAELQTLIQTFHNSGTRVVADIVANHTEAMASWCDFAVQNFGEYGVFQPDGSYICSTDEMNWKENDTPEMAGECWGTATGKEDDGANWDAARDWSHSEVKVQEMFKAYLQWMRNEIGYDGWRYDKGDGFHNWHMDNYNNASDPYIAFMECWTSNGEIKRRIGDANYNVMAFDFQTMYRTFKDGGIVSGNYSNCQVNGIGDWDENAIGLLASGMSKYAVTFIDNHDMFLRNDGEFGGNGNSMKDFLKDKLLQSNAYLLSMPGVPCVFYPHWAKYKEDIKPMINARHLAGVHSESEVRDEEVSQSGYKATIVGTNGYLILMLGDKTVQDAKTPGYEWLDTYGYQLIAKGNGYAMWVSAEGEMAPKVIATPSTTFEDLENGIRVEMQAVGGSCQTPTIYYTLDGTEPTTSSKVYSSALTIKQTTTLKVMTVCGLAQSKVQTYTYTYREPLKRGIQVHFNKPEMWDKVYVYAWIPGVDADGNVTSENIMGAYPGQRIYMDAEGWFSYEFDLSMDSVHFCINSGNDCGGLNVRSNDLVTDYDVYYGWEEGFELESSYEKMYEEIPELSPEFDLVISPESGNFRDLMEGQEVSLHVVGKPGAMIYYSVDGSDPSMCPEPVADEIKLVVKQTSTIRAYAYDAVSQTMTNEYQNTYTYKEPQQGAITVKYFKPHSWEELYLYAFTRVKKGTRNVDTPYSLDGKSAKWPGMKWTTFEQIGEDSVYHFTMKDDVKEIYIIFTEGINKPQSQDIYLDEDICYIWNPECGRAVETPNCDGKTPLYTVEEDDMQVPLENPKFIREGNLYIRINGAVYDATGRLVK